MQAISRFFRLLRINYVLVRYQLDEIIFALPAFYPLRFFKRTKSVALVIQKESFNSWSADSLST